MAASLPMDLDRDTQLREAARAWLAATDRVTAAIAAGEEGEVLRLADEATVARLQLQQVLMAHGWTPPRPVSQHPPVG